MWWMVFLHMKERFYLVFDYRLDVSEIPCGGWFSYITVRINESIAFSLIIQPQILALNICTPCH